MKSVAFGLLVMFAGCSSTQVLRAPSAGSQVCPKQHSKADVIVCDQLSPTRPYLALPEKTESSGQTTFVGAISPGYMYGYNGGVSVVDSQAHAYRVVDGSAAPIKDLTGLPKNLKMPNNRYLFTVYEITGAVSGENIKISEMKPFAEISGCAIDSLFLGDWEGTAYARTETGFDSKTQVPVYMTFDHLQPMRGLTNWKGSAVEKDAAVYGLVGSVENMGAISSDPFKGATKSEIELFRITAMHIPGDNHLAVNYPPGTQGLSPTGMGELRLLAPENLIRQTELTSEAWSSVELRPHSPGFGPGVNVIHLHPVRIGQHAGDLCPAK